LVNAFGHSRDGKTLNSCTTFNGLPGHIIIKKMINEYYYFFQIVP
jgi:hypothetical protein